MPKLSKPLFPARDLNYIPVYKNVYHKVGNGFSVVNQSFGENLNPLYTQLGMKGHNGLDIACVDATPVFASHDGKVIAINDKVSYGLGVTILSTDGTYKTIYWHLKGFNCQVGDLVKAYDLIGYADNTGQSTGTHLHFGYYPIPGDPLNGFDGASDPLPFIEETPHLTFNNNLWIGKSGEDVKNLQIALANEGFLGQVGFFGFTSYFGTQTFQAVQMFQRKYGIWATGFCGKLTRDKLNELFS